MRAAVLRGAECDEFPIDEGCLITELSNGNGDDALSIAQARVPVGVTTRWHCLNGVAERYLIRSGTGSAEIGDQPPAAVAAGDVVLIPPGCRQRIRNTGDDDLVFLALCTPRFTPDCYVDLDDA